VSTLPLIRQSRDLGFSIEQIRELLGLWQNRRRPSRQVKAQAQSQIWELDQKLQELQAVNATVEHLVHCCTGDGRPDCPVIDNLADESSLASSPVSPRVKTSPLRPRRH
jgi:hypothetical protein